MTQFTAVHAPGAASVRMDAYHKIQAEIEILENHPAPEAAGPVGAPPQAGVAAAAPANDPMEAVPYFDLAGVQGDQFDLNRSQCTPFLNFLCGTTDGCSLVNKYLAEAYVPPREETWLPNRGEVLTWWFERRHNYPQMYLLVQKYMCIMATESNEERHLSGAALTYTNLRQSMNEETLDNIMVVKYNPEYLANWLPDPVQ